MPNPPSPHERLLAHGVGGPSDLPIPASYAFVGAAVALLLSFVVLAFAWREPRFDGDASGRPLPGRLAGLVDSRITHGVLVVLSLVFTGWVAMAAIFGSDTLVNPTFGVVFVLLWVGLVPAALLLGPVYRLCNPMRWVHRGISAAAATDYREGLSPYPERLGYWPGAVFLFAFVWLELVDPSLSSSLSSVRLWVGIVAALLMVGAAVYGDTFFARADPFEVYSSLVARLSPFGRRTDGVLVVRNPLENLDGLTPRRGLVAVVAVLFGSTAFDSFKESTRWLRFAQDYTAHQVLLNSIALLAFCLIVFASFSLASWLTAGLGSARGKGQVAPPRASRPDGPLGGADRGRLHRGALLVLLRLERDRRRSNSSVTRCRGAGR